MENTTTIINTETTAMTASDTVQDAATTEGDSVSKEIADEALVSTDGAAEETADEGKIRIPGFQVLGLKKICGTSD